MGLDMGAETDTYLYRGDLRQSVRGKKSWQNYKDIFTQTFCVINVLICYYKSFYCKGINTQNKFLFVALINLCM